jgi:hypothetical protein
VSGAFGFGTGVQPAVSINAGAGVANGAAMDNKSCRANHTMAAVTSAGVSAGTVQLQGSLDGNNWFNIGAPVNTNAAGTVFPLSAGATPARFVRAQITVAITGGTVTVTVGSA